MKKTLLITIDFPPQKGGVANYLANFSKNTPKDKIVVLANKQERDQSFDDKHDYRTIRRDLYYPNFWPHWLKTFFIARKVIKEEKIEQLIISHILPMGYVAMLLDKPFIIILHGFDVLAAKKTIWKKFWLKIILKKAQHLIVNSQFTKNEILKEGIAEDKITTLNPCPNIQLSDLNQSEKQTIINELDLHHKKILLSVGRLVPRKGFDNVIKALPAVLEKIPNLIYILAGKGDYKKELDELATKLNVRGNVIFIENAPDSHLASYFDLADIFIMPSRVENQVDAEGFGIVYLEAGLFGKPVIAGKSGGTGEAVIDRETGILVNPESVQEISQAILNLFNNPGLMNKLGEQGKKRVLNEFQWDKQVAKLKDIL